MAPRNERPVDPTAGKDFFTTVSRDGFPSPKARAQPWKNIWTGAQGKDTQADGKMIVACAIRHDYGMQSPCLHQDIHVDTQRFKWSRRILVAVIEVLLEYIFLIKKFHIQSGSLIIALRGSQLTARLMRTLELQPAAEGRTSPKLSSSPTPRYPRPPLAA